MDLESMSKRELIALIKHLMKEMREVKRELGYEKSEKLSEMFKPAVDEEPKKQGAKEGHKGVTRPMPEKTREEKAFPEETLSSSLDMLSNISDQVQ